MKTPGADGTPSDAGDGGDFNDDLSDLGIVIPDDLSELDDEVRAYRRELRGERRRALLRHPLSSSRRHEPPTPWSRGRARPALPVLIIALLLPIAMVMAMILIVLPQSLRAQPHTLPLANVRTRAGQLGGTLPAGNLILNGRPIALQDHRPGAIVLVPGSCTSSQSCDDVLTNIAEEAAFHGVPLYLIAENGTSTQLNGLEQLAGEFPTITPVETDPHGLLSVYRPDRLTVIPVHADGVVTEVDRNVTQVGQIDTQFSILWEAGAPS